MQKTATTTRNQFTQPLPRLAGFAALTFLCFLASNLAVKGFQDTLSFFIVLVFGLCFVFLLARRPELSFCAFLLVQTDILGLFPYEAMPVFNLGFGSVSVLDILILVPFAYLYWQTRTGRREPRPTPLDGPVFYLFLIVLIGLANSIIIDNAPYRQAIRFARPYLNYFSFFIVIMAVQDQKTFHRLLKAVAVLVAVGCLVQTIEFLMGQNFMQILRIPEAQMALERSGYRVITITGQQITRFLPKTGNFALAMFFVSLFFLLGERPRKTRILFSILFSLSLISIFLAFGRTLYLMGIAGLVVGAYLQKDHRKLYISRIFLFFGIGIGIAALLTLYSVSRGENVMYLMWMRLIGISQDIMEGRDTFGFRLWQFGESFRRGIQNLPLGVGFRVGGEWDVGLLNFFLQFGILGPVFYVWILKKAIPRFLEVYRKPLSEDARCLMKGLGCYGFSQAIVLPIQDPFPVPIGILIVVLFLAIVECVNRFELLPSAQVPRNGTL